MKQPQRILLSAFVLLVLALGPTDQGSTIGTITGGSGESNRPDEIRTCSIDNPRVEGWFNVSDFVVVPANSYSYGNASRRSLTAPGCVPFDLAVAKSCRKAESQRLELCRDHFNVPNRMNFKKPEVNIKGALPGVITSAMESCRRQVA